VCGEFPDATYAVAVNQRFLSRYVVTDASSRRPRGNEG
jgi:hypothetical protein